MNTDKTLHTRVTDADTLGLVLRESRHRMGISQDQLALRLGLSQRYVSELENGKPGKLMTRLFQIMSELDVTLTAEIKRR